MTQPRAGHEREWIVSLDDFTSRWSAVESTTRVSGLELEERAQRPAGAENISRLAIDSFRCLDHSWRGIAEVYSRSTSRFAK
jgi:hypothetical protein